MELKILLINYSKINNNNNHAIHLKVCNIKIKAFTLNLKLLTMRIWSLGFKMFSKRF